MHLPHITPFASSPVYFFTACVAGRRQILACGEVLAIVEDIWRNSATYDGWFVGRFTIMPDHVHFFASPNRSAKARPEWCKTWKSISSRRVTKALGVSPPIWQPDTFDHILRGTESYSEKWEYVAANPVRAGLCATTVEWPWQGEIHSLAF
jgi:putative transposase